MLQMLHIWIYFINGLRLGSISSEKTDPGPLEKADHIPKSTVSAKKSF